MIFNSYSRKRLCQLGAHLWCRRSSILCSTYDHTFHYLTLLSLKGIPHTVPFWHFLPLSQGRTAQLFCENPPSFLQRTRSFSIGSTHSNSTSTNKCPCCPERAYSWPPPAYRQYQWTGRHLWRRYAKIARRWMVVRRGKIHCCWMRWSRCIWDGGQRVRLFYDWGCYRFITSRDRNEGRGPGPWVLIIID